MDLETTRAPSRLLSLLAAAPTACGLFGLGVGVVVLSCWWLRVEGPLSIVPGLPPMMATTALMAALDGAALTILSRANSATASALGKLFVVGCALLGSMLLAEYGFRVDLGIDRVLATTRWLTVAHAHAGRSSVQSTSAFVLIASSLLVFDRRRTARRLSSEILALVAGLLGLAALLGYLFEAAIFYAPESRVPHAGMSIPSAVSALVLSFGVLSSYAETGILSVLRARDSGGIAARTMIAWLLALAPPIVAIELGTRLGFYDDAFATAFIVLFGFAGGCAVVFRLARHLSRLDAERRTSQRELERVREEWAAVVAHDLRQPVSTISLAAQSLTRPHRELTDREARAVERIHDASARLNRMIGDLTDASLIDSKRIAIECSDVDLGKFAGGVVESLREVTAGHDVRTAIPPDLHAWVDADRIHQVMGNLISNAVKYGSPETDIVIEAERHASDVEVTIKNRGPGIPPTEMNDLFEKFSRTTSAKRTRQPGLGLGLYIARGLIEAHGGKLWAESEQGATTSFHFTVKAEKHAT
jgi:signal transduction histidine kinase